MGLKNIIRLLGILLIMGCASSPAQDNPVDNRQLMENYLSKVVKYDGINYEEAVILAQSQLVFRDKEKEFRYDRPELAFPDETFWVIQFPPINTTLAELISRPNALIWVRKDNGETFWEEQ
jgi:hypothetical protein